jgi:hypothetical protein
MQEVMVGQSARVFVPTSSSAQRSAASEASQARLPGVARVWRMALHTLSAHSLSILACALLGLVGVALLGALVNAALTFDAYFRTGGIFPTYANTFYVQLYVQAGLGIFAMSLGRGTITWIALCDARGERVTLRAALRRSLARLPELLLSSLIYGALVTLGIAGLSLVLRQLRLDVTSVGRVGADFDSMMRVISVRVVNGFVPDPGSPFTELISYGRYLLRRSSTNYYWLYAYRYTVSDVPLRLWLIGLASLLPLIAGGALLRMRVAAIMDAPQANRAAALGESIQLGARHFGYLFRHGALVWLVSSLLTILFVFIPLALVQYLLIPPLARTLNSLWPYPASTLLFAAGTALITMVFMAFAAVYDAHLYVGLRRAAASSSASAPARSA